MKKLKFFPTILCTRKFFSIELLLAIGLLVASCGTETEQNTGEPAGTDTIAMEEDNSQFKVKKNEKVFYTVPSPIEICGLLKRAGAKYNKEILNNPDNVSKYATTSSMALNLGIYGGDLSFTSMFEQTQETMVYFSCVKRLADKLGITATVNKDLLARVQNNIDNRDSLVAIISDYYWESDAYLKENKQSSLAALIITGGWLEGIYIGSKLAKTTGNRELIGRIGEQRMSLNNLIALLESYVSEDPSLQMWVNEMITLRDAYEGVDIKYSRDEPVTDPQTQTTTITTLSTVSINDQQFDKIAAVVVSIRNKIINS